MLRGPANTAEPCRISITSSDQEHRPPPPKSARGPSSQCTAAGLQLPEEFLMVPVAGRRWNRRSEGRSQSWAGTWVGAMGRSCCGCILSFFHWKANDFLSNFKLQMTVTIYSKMSFVFHLKKCWCSGRVPCLFLSENMSG